jgi:hypothetical protein
MIAGSAVTWNVVAGRKLTKSSEHIQFTLGSRHSNNLRKYKQTLKVYNLERWRQVLPYGRSGETQGHNWREVRQMCRSWLWHLV